MQFKSSSLLICYSIALLLGICVIIGCQTDKQERDQVKFEEATDDQDDTNDIAVAPEEPADGSSDKDAERGIAILTQSLDDQEGVRIRPIESFDAGDWRAFVVGNVRVVPGPSPHKLVNLSTEEILSGREAMAVLVEHFSEAEKLARVTNAFLGPQGIVITTPSDAPRPETRSYISVPNIDGTTLEFWFLTPGRWQQLMRARVDLETLQIRRDPIYDLQPHLERPDFLKIPE